MCQPLHRKSDVPQKTGIDRGRSKKPTNRNVNYRSNARTSFSKHAYCHRKILQAVSYDRSNDIHTYIYTLVYATFTTFVEIKKKELRLTNLRLYIIYIVIITVFNPSVMVSFKPKTLLQCLLYLYYIINRGTANSYQ